MSPLYTRDECIQCGCPEFIPQTPGTDVPSLPTESCYTCSDLWFTHSFIPALTTGPEAEKQRIRRLSLGRTGPPGSMCGGFHPADSSVPCTRDSLCTCRKPMSAHPAAGQALLQLNNSHTNTGMVGGVLQASSGAARVMSDAVPRGSGAPINVPTASPAPSSLGSPIAAFASTARPPLYRNGTAEQNRQASQKRKKGGTSGTSGGYKHHPFPGPSLSFGSSAPSSSGTLFHIAFLPLTYDSLYMDKQYHPTLPTLRDNFQVSNILSILGCVGLSSTITVVAPLNDHDVFWRTFHQQVVDTIDSPGYQLPPAPGRCSPSPDNMTFEQVPFYVMNRSAHPDRNQHYKLSPAFHLVFYTLRANLSTKKNHWENPLGDNPPLVIFLCPKFGNLAAPIISLLDDGEICPECLHLPHGCFGFRLLPKLDSSWLEAEAIDPDFDDNDRPAGHCRPDICPTCTFGGFCCWNGHVRPAPSAGLLLDSIADQPNSMPASFPFSFSWPHESRLSFQVPLSPGSESSGLPSPSTLFCRPLPSQPATEVPPNPSAVPAVPSPPSPADMASTNDIEFDVPLLPDISVVEDAQAAIRNAVSTDAAFVSPQARPHICGRSSREAAQRMLESIQSLLSPPQNTDGQSVQNAIDVDAVDEDLSGPEDMSECGNTPDGDCEEISSILDDFRLPSVISLIHTVGTYEVSVSDNSTSAGCGVRSNIFKSACDIMFSHHHYWGESFMGYYLPDFHDGRGQKERLCKWEAFGALLGISLPWITTTQASPFILIALLAHNDELYITPEIIALFDKQLVVKLLPWFKHTPGDSIKYGSPLANFLINELNMQPGAIMDIQNAIASGSTERKRKQLLREWYTSTTSTFLCRVIFDWPELFKNDEFQALRRGFNQSLPSETSIISILQNHAPTNNDVARLVGRMYDRHVKSATDVISKILVCNNRQHAETTVLKQMLDTLFHRRLERYLQGCGDPRKPTPDGDPLLRSRLLLEVLTSSPLLPARKTWSIMLEFREPKTTPNNQGEAKALAAVFQSCFTSISVVMSDMMYQLILQPVQGDAPTAFDKWFHTTLLASLNHFNTA
ncbi:hypothetical protein K474DRAFT_1710834 [Panus rudis PR-1116 ss-1]|nr:hypothetical protein K474DRAFT_1710834 [Panus rudis PR-1116 ss-1]